MSHLTPPWCLHWGRDGELAQSDRQDLLPFLVREASGMARLMPAHTKGLAERRGGPAAMAEEQPSPALIQF